MPNKKKENRQPGFSDLEVHHQLMCAQQQFIVLKPLPGAPAWGRVGASCLSICRRKIDNPPTFFLNQTTET